MDSITVVSLLITAVSVAFAAGILLARPRRDRKSQDRDRERDARDQKLVERVVELVDHRLSSGMQEMGSRGQITAKEMQNHFQEVVSGLQQQSALQHGEVTKTLKGVSEGHHLLTKTTGDLSQALASNQTRGQWGERAAEDVLRAAGMAAGIQYHKQATLADGSRPDFTFLLPENLKLHMDVKFPYNNYLRHLEAETDHEREATMSQYLKDVRARVKEVAKPAYIDKDTTVGYALLFIPVESIYGFIHEHDSTVIDDAMQQGVVLCSPYSLFAQLAMVRKAIDTFALARSTGEILSRLQAFGLQWQKYSDEIDRVGKQLGTVSSTFESLSSTRRNQLQKQIEKIDELRANAQVSDAAPALREVEVG